MAFKMNARSPLMKTLKGGQKNLPQALKSAIEAAPGKMMESPAKNMNKGYGTPSPAKAMTGPGVQEEAGKTGTGGANSAAGKNAKSPQRSYAPGTPQSKFNPAEVKPSKASGSKPKYDKELNSLVASRKGLKKGTSEYNKVQNQINAKLGSSVRRKVEPAKPTPKKETLISKESRNPVGELNLAPAPKTPQLTKSKKPAKKNSPRVTQTANRATVVTKSNGVKKKETVNKNTGNKKVVVKDANTRTVTKTNKAGESTTKTTKRIGKGRIKEALANRKEAKQNKKALKQTKKANVSVDGAPTKPRNNSMVSAK